MDDGALVAKVIEVLQRDQRQDRDSYTYIQCLLSRVWRVRCLTYLGRFPEGRAHGELRAACRFATRVTLAASLLPQQSGGGDGAGE